MVDRLPEPQAHTRQRRHRLVGTISSAGSASGDRFVVGSWSTSPIGPFTDVFWAPPAGERILLVGPDREAGFDGRDLGPLVHRWTAGVFGFSEPPTAPAVARVRPVLHHPSGRPDGVVA